MKGTPLAPELPHDLSVISTQGSIVVIIGRGGKEAKCRLFVQHAPDQGDWPLLYPSYSFYGAGDSFKDGMPQSLKDSLIPKG